MKWSAVMLIRTETRWGHGASECASPPLRRTAACTLWTTSEEAERGRAGAGQDREEPGPLLEHRLPPRSRDPNPSLI